MNIYRLNEKGVKELFAELKKTLPKEQAEEMHHALYRRGLKRWFDSAWLADVADKLETSAGEHDSTDGAWCEIRWYTPRKGVAIISAEPDWFDVDVVTKD